jgi:hypothetical protein
MGSLNDLVEEADLGDAGKCSIVCELVSLVVDYEEEGQPLFLDVFIAEDIVRLTSSIPQSFHMKLGVCSLSEEGVKQALKKTAPLVRTCWRMYFSLRENEFEYGLFRDSGHPLNAPLEFVLPSGDVPDLRFIRVTKLGEDTVRVSSHCDTENIVHFTNARGSEDTENSLGELAALICSNVLHPLGQSTETFLTQLLLKASRESHGLLIAVVKSKNPVFLKDCVPLSPPISISAAVELVRQDPVGLSELQALESLVIGMFGSDGIVVFNTQASVIAYNAFIKLRASTASGGARRRAYMALLAKLGHGVLGAFIQSEDGASNFGKFQP